MNRMKKATMATGVALALTLGVSVGVNPAFATIISAAGTPGYLSAPEVSTTSTDIGTNPATTFQVTTTTSSNTSGPTTYITPSSTFGNTFVNPGPGIKQVQSTINTSNQPTDVSYSHTGLDLQLLNSMVSNYNLVGTTSSSGQVISNVYTIGPTHSMPGAVTGELVFTYQFDVTSLSPSTSNGPTGANLALFNNPNATGLWTLGDGIMSNPIGPLLSCAGCSTVGTASITGSTNLDAANGSVNSVEYGFSSVDLNQISPQYFVASNSFDYTLGSIGLLGAGTGQNVSIFVPGTPEPGTILLFGTGLGLLAFMAFRKKANQVTI